mmetsp:Transcript_5873/g.13047  ORF Transcript_5873/g.13047 Transcript_5873/m.13047 type:complete len:203 (-) Transcript_5873:1278-1886(-)
MSFLARCSSFRRLLWRCCPLLLADLLNSFRLCPTNSCTDNAYASQIHFAIEKRGAMSDGRFQPPLNSRRKPRPTALKHPFPVPLNRFPNKLPSPLDPLHQLKSPSPPDPLHTMDRITDKLLAPMNPLHPLNNHRTPLNSRRRPRPTPLRHPSSVPLNRCPKKPPSPPKLPKVLNTYLKGSGTEFSNHWNGFRKPLRSHWKAF